MNKHFIGILLFTTIVTVSGVVAFVFGDLPKIEAPKLIQPAVFESKTRCNKMKYRSSKSDATVKIYQAVLNQDTGVLNTNLIVKRADEKTDSVYVALHFFVKDGYDTRYLNTETLLVVPDFSYRNSVTHPVLSSFDWLENLSSHENLYVVAERTNYREFPKSVEPAFNPANATAVIVERK